MRKRRGKNGWLWRPTPSYFSKGKIKAFFKRLKPETKGKKAVEPAETKAAEAPEKKPGESS